MKNILLLTMTVLFSAGIGAIITYIPLKQQIAALEKNIAAQQVSNRNLKEQVSELQGKEAVKLQEQKKAVEATAKVGLAYFTATVKPLSATEKQVDIYLKGDTSLDAVDLVLSHTDAVRVKEIRKGTVFVSYPRLIDKDNTITVTGVAMPQGDTFAYGKTGGIYATIIVESAPKGALIMNTKDTQAYYSGTPVLDFTSSFAQIAL